ncbi:glycosyltransferase [Corticibacterium sp. UT-5YL-CI-8]|nr:glycosyltransferase [Tianweitania sp. UT-5YL-CI-8]
MTLTIWLLVLAAVGLLTFPVMTFVVECIAGALSRAPDHSQEPDIRPAVAVLVPAHNEETGIVGTVKSIMTQIRPGDRVLVVADNCTDGTAAAAREARAEVIERTDPARRGKGFALDFGLAHLRVDPPAVVVFVDADCTLLPGTLDTLAGTVWSTGQPVQASNLMITREDQKKAFGIAEFAFLVKNHVRSRGLARLGLPCQLTGTGMALPWQLASNAQLADAEVVEDMKLGLDLGAGGHFPIYCETAGVRSFFPDTADGAVSQRRRWESGHLGILVSGLRRLANRHTWSLPYAVMVLDVMVPPLALLVLLIAALTLFAAVAALMGAGVLPFVISIILGTLLSGAIILAWSTHGRTIIPLHALLHAPRYALGKSIIYAEILFGRSEHAWIRTSRTADAIALPLKRLD